MSPPWATSGVAFAASFMACDSSPSAWLSWAALGAPFDGSSGSVCSSIVSCSSAWVPCGVALVCAGFSGFTRGMTPGAVFSTAPTAAGASCAAHRGSTR